MLTAPQKKQIKSNFANEIFLGAAEKKPEIRTNTLTPIIEKAAKNRIPKEEQFQPNDWKVVWTRMTNTAAELVALAGGDVQLFPGAAAEVRAVAAAARSAVIARGDDFVVAHDNGAVFAAQTGGALQNGVGDVKIIVLLAGAVIHGAASRC